MGNDLPTWLWWDVIGRNDSIAVFPQIWLQVVWHLVNKRDAILSIYVLHLFSPDHMTPGETQVQDWG
jgi:hypothetical protein